MRSCSDNRGHTERGLLAEKPQWYLLHFKPGPWRDGVPDVRIFTTGTLVSVVLGGGYCHRVAWTSGGWMDSIHVEEGSGDCLLTITSRFLFKYNYFHSSGTFLPHEE